MRLQERLPEAKKARLAQSKNMRDELHWKLLFEGPSSLPQSLIHDGPIRNDLSKLRQLLDKNGFRTAMLSSPREALSLYIDSFHHGADGSVGRFFLITLFGLHPNQSAFEKTYPSSIKIPYCLMLFCKRIRSVCEKATENQELANLLRETEQNCKNLADEKITWRGKCFSEKFLEAVSTVINLAVKVDPRLRKEQLQKEYQRICVLNSTLSNAYVQKFVQVHSCTIQSMVFKHSPMPKYQRITISLYNSEIDVVKPAPFLFLPALELLLTQGTAVLVEQMARIFWSTLLRRGYFATANLKDCLEPELKKYFLSGLTNDPSLPLFLNAHFSPTYSLSFYIHGKAGAGKSSLARNFAPALHAAIAQYADPELLVRFVKQNLNKDMRTLELELDLRPNNNDLSVMSTIQSRQMTMGQSKPGLVCVGLEEMPGNHTNPPQVEVAQLISQRFSGRKGVYVAAEGKPRNVTKRGISGDAAIVAIFTSNYVLDEEPATALKRLDMFSNLHCVQMNAVSGIERHQFANVYLRQSICDSQGTDMSNCEVQLDIPLGEGDTRCLVRILRMLAFYICAMVRESLKADRSIYASVIHAGGSYQVAVGMDTMQLKMGSLNILLPLKPRAFNKRTLHAAAVLSNEPAFAHDGLSMVFDFWLAQTLAPAVILSRNPQTVRKIAEVAASLTDVRSILGVDVSQYKMMKSLYDKTDTSNLRDDILNFGKGTQVVIELKCVSTEAQMAIREIIEDTPSMTAFSSENSALHKSGLLFVVSCETEITPEILSRASLVI